MSSVLQPSAAHGAAPGAVPPASASAPAVGAARERRALVLLALGAMAGLLLAGWGLFNSAPAHRVPPHAVALVNGRPILRTDFRAQVEVLQSEPFDKTTAAQRREVLQSMIEEELFVQRGLEVGLPDSDPDVRSALAGAVRLQASADVRATALDETALRRWFGAHAQRYCTDFDAVRSRVSLDARREQQRAAEQQLLAHLREKAQVDIADDAAR